MRICLALFSYGGIDGETLDCVMAEMFYAQRQDIPMLYSRVSGDALISRSRSVAMSAFLKSQADVLFMLDHDVTWETGNLVATCEVALRERAIVGGMYSNRAEGMGFSGRLTKDVGVRLGADELFTAQYVGAGFTAYPRSVVEAVLEAGKATTDPNAKLTECSYIDGSKFWDFFRCIVVENRELGVSEYLSEDWSLAWRAQQAQQELYYWTKPVLQHWGRAGFLMAKSQPAVSERKVKLH